MKKRTTQEIKEDLQNDREALSADLDALLTPKRRRRRDAVDTAHLPEPEHGGAGWPAVLAGAGIGLLFLTRPLWPLRVVGRLVGFAAPVALPLVVNYIRERRESTPIADDA